MALNAAWVSVASIISPVDSTAVTRTSVCSVSASLASRALVSSIRMSPAASGAKRPCSTIQQKMRWSKSSPPSAESPWVDNTSNTPLDSFKIEISKVPPPRSYTA